jgi:Zn-dependent peptidase ImmA (M78 family)
VALKIPFLPDQSIESAALELLAKFGKAQGVSIVPPIPVDEIIEAYLKVSLEITDLRAKLGKPDVLGAAYFDEGIIRVDERLEEQEGRLCFTMAHEVGHWQLHRPLYEMDKVAPTMFGAQEAAPAFLCRSSLKPPAEIQADKFAARLLMPGRFVRDAYNLATDGRPRAVAGLAGRKVDANGVAAWSETARSVMAKGNFSNVSVEAMRYRLADLGLVRDAASAAAQPNLF